MMYAVLCCFMFCSVLCAPLCTLCALCSTALLRCAVLFCSLLDVLRYSLLRCAVLFCALCYYECCSAR